jgi:tRNA pseudouridine55 synthase
VNRGHVLTPRESPGAATEGLLVLDKPRGPTSHDAVTAVRHATGLRKVGHIGTLDPFATGVLPLLLGPATRLAQFLAMADKEYEADLRLGASTDTYDLTGRVLDTGRGEIAEWPRPADVEAAVAAFRGTYLQTPPSFSAKKVLGTPAFRLARSGHPVQLEPVEVTAHAVDVLELANDRLRIRVVCSSGFYVRALAHAIGERLRTGAYLEALVRTRCGEYTLDQASSLNDLQRAPAEVLARLIPVDRLLGNLPAAVLTPDGVVRAEHGNLIGPRDLVCAPDCEVPGSIRLLDERGRLVAVARPTDRPGVLHPGVVLR